MNKKYRFLSIVLMLTLALSAFLSTSCNKNNGQTANSKLVHGGTVVETSDKVVANGASDYVIVVPTVQDTYDKQAEQTLIKFFSEATSITLPVKLDSEVTWSDNLKAISLGQTAIADAAGLSNQYAERSGCSYQVKTKGKTIFVLGDKLGVVYGVQEILNRMFNFEYFTEYTYSLDKGVSEEPLCIYDISEVPDIEYRSAIINGVLEASPDSYYMVSLRYNNFGNAYWGPSTHNALEFVPYDRTHVKGNQEKLEELFDAADPVEGFGEAHRNWYSDRMNGHTAGVPDQMCYSRQDEYYDIILAKLKTIVVLTPEASCIEYSIEDTNTWCGCSDCTAAKTKYGTDGALMYKMLSRLAKDLNDWIVSDEGKALTPTRDVYILTLAYQRTREAAAVYNEKKGMYEPVAPEIAIDDHMLVQYCTRGADMFVATNAPANAGFYKDMMAWKDMTKQLAMWKYHIAWYGEDVQFNPYFSCMQEDFQFLVSCDLLYMFDEGMSGLRKNVTAFQSLRTYLQSKLVWNCNIDYEAAMTRYFENCYGPAADTMRSIFDSMEANLTRQYLEGKIRGYEHWLMQKKYYAKGFLENILDQYDLAYEQINAVKGDMDANQWARLERRVATEKLSADYMYVEIYEKEIPADELLARRLEYKKNTIRLDITVGGCNRSLGFDCTLAGLFEAWGIQ